MITFRINPLNVQRGLRWIANENSVLFGLTIIALVNQNKSSN